MKKENKSNSSNVHVVVNTKGGCGKSTCSSILATLLYLNNPKKIVNILRILKIKLKMFMNYKHLIQFMQKH